MAGGTNALRFNDDVAAEIHQAMKTGAGLLVVEKEVKALITLFASPLFERSMTVARRNWHNQILFSDNQRDCPH